MQVSIILTRDGVFIENDRRPFKYGIAQQPWATSYSTQFQGSNPSPVLSGGRDRSDASIYAERSGRISDDCRCPQHGSTPERDTSVHHRNANAPFLDIRLRGGPLPDDKAKEPKSGSAPDSKDTKGSGQPEDKPDDKIVWTPDWIRDVRQPGARGNQ